jgi:hypothetical protein
MRSRRRSGRQVVDRTIVDRDLIQIQADHLTIQPGVVVRSNYLEQVKRIAPPELLERDAELVDLAAFCCEPGKGPYAWWRGPHWAGKSALMSWFVLNPPPSVHVVSFFVTARFPSQSDRLAFTNALLEQLLDLLGRSMPPYLTSTTREPFLIKTLMEAAEACQERGKRLILLVDGLDEDCGVTTGPDAYSIAALLPQEPRDGLRVIVTGRRSPSIPDDVPDDHPLRHPAIARRLEPSPHAKVVRIDMQRELKRLLRGTAAERDLLGLITAAGGGLSARDIAELLSLPEYDVNAILSSVTGRTFDARPSPWRPSVSPNVYILGHNELQVASARSLGAPELEQYRQRLHDWADSYRLRGWPAETSEYLLRDYSRLLREIGDISRLVACATDWARHGRMLEVTSSDSAAVDEITITQDILSQRESNLAPLARLAVHRARIAEQNAEIPPRLPAVWAYLGEPGRAEAVARAISDPKERADAMVLVVRAVADNGDLDRAHGMARQAEDIARSIPDDSERERIFAGLSHALAVNEPGSSRRNRPAAPAEWDFLARVSALVSAAKVVSDKGDLDRARTLVKRAERPAKAIDSAYWRAMALSQVARAAAAVRDLDNARAFARCAEETAATIANDLWRKNVRIEVARTVEYFDDSEKPKASPRQAAETARLSTLSSKKRAENLAMLAWVAAYADDEECARILAEHAEEAVRAATNEGWRAHVSTKLAKTLAEIGDVDRAYAAARKAPVANNQASYAIASALAEVAWAAVRTDDVDRARALISEAEEASRAIGSSYDRARALADVARAAVRVGEVDRARALTREAEEAAQNIKGYGQAEVLARVAKAAADVGDRDWAQELDDQGERRALAIRRTDVLIALCEAAADAGDVRRARDLARRVAETPSGITEDTARHAARAMAGAREWEMAEAMVATIDNPAIRAAAVVDLAQAATGPGDSGRFLALCERAEKEVNDIPAAYGAYQPALSLGQLASAAAHAGQRERASRLVRRGESLIRSLNEGDARAKAFIALVPGAEPHDARSLIANALVTGHWRWSLDVLGQIDKSAIVALADEYQQAYSTR